MKSIAVILVFLMPLISAKAQTGSDEWATWYLYFGTTRISEKFSIFTEFQLNYWEMNKNRNQTLYVGVLNYHLNPKATLSLGYAYSDFDPSFGDGLPGAPVTNKLLENRLFQQFNYSHGNEKVKWAHRFRQEQRFFNNLDTRVLDTQHRFRYRLQATIPIGNKYFGIVNDEIFFNYQNQFYNQNRFFIGIGRHITSNSKVQVGYLNIDFRQANYHRIWIGFSFNPDLRKKSTP
jgi:hypothetical protein